MDPPVLLLDSGANINVTPEYLVQFGIIGSEFMKNMYGVESPRVGLLNNGEEKTKGTELQTQTYKLHSECDNINFIGNVEGNGIAKNKCDVLVTDGFTGNILLKSIEGMGKLMMSLLKDIFGANLGTKIGYLLVKKKLGAVKKALDSSEHGGAPLLGISKPVIKAHGSSNAKAFKNAIRQAAAYAESGMIEKITENREKLFAKKKPEAETNA